RGVERELIAHGGRGAGVEGQQEGFDVTPLRVAAREREYRQFQEVEQIVDRAVVREAEATLVLRVQAVAESRLLVQVTQLRYLDVLRLLQRGRVHELAVGAGGKRVAAHALEETIVRVVLEAGKAARRARLAQGCCGERAVQVLARVRREVHALHEGVEERELSRRELAVVAEQALEGRIELVEPGAVAAPVEGLSAADAAQGLRDHRALHGMEALEERID